MYQSSTHSGIRVSLVIYLASLFGLHTTASAATYYVATTGSDTTGNGSYATPWKTISKAATTMASGDVCQIRGGTYRETVTPAASGTTFQAYGNEIVAIDGTELVTGWTANGTNQWKSTVNWASAYTADTTGIVNPAGDGNQVFRCNEMMPEARWPNAALTLPQSAAASGPLGYWRFNENAGSYAANVGSLGSTQTAQLLGAATFSAVGPQSPNFKGFEQTNTAVSLTGSTSQILVPNNGAFAFGSGAYAVEMWFYPTNATTRGDLFTYKGPEGDFGIHLSSQTSGKISVYHNGFVGSAGGTITNNTWYHLVVTRSATSTVTAYLNGSQIISGTDTQTMSITNSLLFGSNHTGVPTNPAYVFPGRIDEAAIYGREITASEALDHYQKSLNGTFPWQNSQLPHPTNSELGDWSYVDSAGYDSNNLNGWFIDAQLPARANGYWTGATVNMIAGAAWVMQSLGVTGYNDSTKTITTNSIYGPTGSAYGITAGNEFYLTGLKGEMDSPGEWFYDPSTYTLSTYSVASPTSVSIKRRNFGFNLSGKTGIKIANIDFFACTVLSNTSTSNITYDGVIMKYLSHNRKAGTTANTGLALRTGDVLRNSELAWDATALVRLDGTDTRVINNYFHDTGYMPVTEGMYGEGASQRNLISHNTLRNSGRGVMSSMGRKSIIEFNDMSNSMKLTNDGAVFYSGGDGDNSVFRYNMLHDSVAIQGANRGAVQGFYLDCQNSNWVIHHNLIWNIPAAAMQINCRYNYNQVFNNTCWNTPGGSLFASFPMNEESGSHIFNNLFDAIVGGNILALSDVRYNIYNNTAMTNVAGVNQGVYIPGITSGTGALYPVTDGAPDIGALETGGTNWTTAVGNTLVPTDPLLTFSLPPMTFANLVLNSSFEDSVQGPLGAPWVVTGSSSVAVNAGPHYNSWQDIETRSGAYALKFTAGTTEVKQTVTGLQPNHRYKLYGGVRRTDANSTVKLGVRNFDGLAHDLSVTANIVNRDVSLGGDPNGYAEWWTVYNQTFITGPTNTTADIYLDVTVPSGGVPVYADDFCVELTQDPSVNPVMTIPIVQYALNETSGTTVYDSTTNNRNGTSSGGITYVAGVTGNAYGFNGSNSQVTTPTVTTPTSITVTCWAKSTTTTWNAWDCLVSQEGPNANKGFFLGPNAGTRDNNFVIYDGATNQQVRLTWNAPTGFDITQWHHYAGVFSPVTQQMSFYVDGVLSATRSAAVNIATMSGPVYIGRADYWWDNVRNLNGYLDDVRIYDTALSSAELKTIASISASQQIHYEFNEPAGSGIAWDSSGAGNSGTLTNMNTATAWGNGSLAFDGVNDCVLTPSITTPTTISVALWAKSATATWNAWDCLVSQEGPNANKGFFLGPNAGTRDNNFVIYDSATNQQVRLTWTAPTGFDITQWHHYVGTFSPTTQQMQFYVDGVLSTTRAAAVNIATYIGPIYVGRADYWWDNVRNFNGSLTDVRVFPRVLSWTEVQDLAFPQEGPPYGP